MGTHLTFSTRMTKLDWSHGGDLLACTLYMPRGRTLSGSCTARGWGSLGVVLGMSATGKQGAEDDKRITVNIFTLLKDAYVMLPRSVTSTDQCLSQKITVLPAFFLSFCSAPSLAHSLASSIISLLSVNLAPCLPLCLFFSPFPSPPSLPPSHFPSLHVPLSIVVICPVANSASVCLSRLCW